MAKKRKFFSLPRFLRITPSKFLLLGSILVAGYFYINPDQIPNSQIRSQVEAYKLDHHGATQSQVIEVLGATTQKAADMIKYAKIPTNLIDSDNLPEEIVIEDVVNNLTDQVKQLPEKQLKKVKVQFCQDVISEATQSAQ